MATIREELVLADKFSATFGRYINLSSTAANASSMASSAASNYQSVLGSLDRRLISLNAQFAAVATRQEALAASGAQNSAEFIQLEQRAERLGSSIRDLQTQYDLVAGQFDEVSVAARKAAGAQDEFAESARGANMAGSNLLGTLKSLAGGYVGIQGVKALVGLSDTMAQTSARLNMVNSQFGTTLDLNQMIYESAQRSRGAYADTADLVGKLGTLAADSFSTPEELIGFAEQINKQYVLSGTSAQGAQAATLQLTQALSSGTLRGEELNSVLEQAPTIVQSIGDYLGKTTGEIRELASEGLITSDIVKAAILSAAEETNAAFEEMPMTWSQVWTMMQNTAIMALQPVLSGVNWLANNIDIIGPPVVAVAGAFAIAGGAIALYTAQQKLSSTWTAIMAARTMLLHGSTIAQTAAQYGLNAAMLGSPVMWVVGGVMLLIGALYGGVAAYNELTDSSVSATGIITGAMGGLFAFVGNGFILLWNIIGEAATFLENVFIHPVEVVKFLFLGMAESVLSYISQMMQGIQDTVNKIPGVEVDITSGINGLISDIQSKSQSIIDNTQWKEYDPIAYMNIGEWAAKGYSLGANFNPFGSGSSFDMDDWLNNTDFATDISDIAGDVSGIQKSVSLADEDIKSLVDMAERRYVNNINLTAQSPVITVQGQNTGDSAADRRALADAIKDILVEQSSSASLRSTARTK
mgnify:CR=1 FL=1|jgi:tape measure domain-containing protein